MADAERLDHRLDGDAALGLLVRGDAGHARRWGLDRGQEQHLVQRYLVPEPRNAAAAAVLSLFESGTFESSPSVTRGRTASLSGWLAPLAVRAAHCRTTMPGGHGAVREVCDWLLAARSNA